MALTARAGLLALLGIPVVVFLLPSTTGVALVAAGVLALVLLDLALAAALSGITVERTGDTAVRLGEQATVVLQVRNTGRRRFRGVVRDAWPPSAGVATDRFALTVPSGEGRRTEVRLRPRRRGDRVARATTLRSLGPLGLAGRQHTRRLTWTVRALPPFESRIHLPSRLERLRELAGSVPVLARGEGTEFDSLRDYVIGDDVRAIDWRATARRNGVVVRTWRPERDRHVLIVVDCGRTSAGLVGEDAARDPDRFGTPRLDHLLDAALLLATLATQAGDRVDLLAYDRQVRASVRRPEPTEALSRFTSALATVESSLTETDQRGLASEILRRAGTHALVVLLTGLEASVVTEGLVPVSGPILRRHRLVLGSVRDPALTALAAGRGDPEAVYDAAAAERALTERREVSARLEQLGVTVVDSSPTAIAPDLADTYLALKRSGQL